MVYPGEAYREDMGTLSDGRITVHIGLRTCCADCMLNWASEQKSHRRRRFSWIFARCCERVNSNYYDVTIHTRTAALRLTDKAAKG